MGRAWSIGLVGMGCGDALVGGVEVDQRIAASPLPERAAWEVRWVGPTGLSVACERLDAGDTPDARARPGTVRLPPPRMPEPRLQEGDGFRWALALPVLVAWGAPFPEAGAGSLEVELGVWGTSAPLAWLEVEGDPEAAGARLRANGRRLESGWVEVFSPLVAEEGAFDGALSLPDPDALQGGLLVTPLQWSDDEELDLWAGDTIGGIASTCGAP